jgi:hypothetical protein
VTVTVTVTETVCMCAAGMFNSFVCMYVSKSMHVCICLNSLRSMRSMRSVSSMRGGFIFLNRGPSLKIHHGQHDQA